jgi:hypothetical protein
MAEAYSSGESDRERVGNIAPAVETGVTERDLRFARIDGKKYACPLMSPR